ncbi:MAG: surface antigen family protein [Rhodocyclaceae bacterium]|nr:surface antigen family protein [Rhodocyclaceae bacterium]
MKRICLMVLLALGGTHLSVSAADLQTTREIAARYAEDKKLCAEESNSGTRMQCLRDAKAEYDRALAAAKSTQSASSRTSQKAASCPDCGRVVAVNVVDKKGEGGPIGMIGGGVAGALLGNQVGRGTGKDLATIAGAAGGAFAGHMIEEKVRATKAWEVRVRLDSGEERAFEFAQDPGFGVGTLVRVANDTVVRR